MTLKELTMTLCGLSGPSGLEDSVRNWITEYIRSFSDEVSIDALGNLLIWKHSGKANAKKLLLDAHMDEIGFIVTGMEDGYLKFASIGGVDPRMLPAREVRVLSEPPLFGVIDTMPPHLLSEEDMGKSIEADKLCIDIGMDKMAAEKAAPPGTFVVYSNACEELGDNQLCGKAMDDRAGVAILLKAFEELSSKELSVDICCLISAQEEVGLRGASVGAWQAMPDYAIVVDVTHAQTPDAGDVSIKAGKGVAIGVGPNMNHTMTRELFRLAEEKSIAHQTEVCPGHSGTNAAAIQISREGVSTALLSLPLKYMHTPFETVYYEDMEAVKNLILAYAESMEG